MSARNILMAAAGSADDKLYVDDVFSAYTYTGNGSSQTINNGIDLAGKGGLVWIKSRTTNGHSLCDTVRGANNRLATNVTNAQANTGIPPAGNLPYFYSTGFEVGSTGDTNASGASFVSWTFRKAPKFFDVVTWTGNGANPGSQTIAHSLGAIPGMVVCKKTSSTSSWFTFHRSLAAKTDYLFLNTTAAATTSGGGQMWDATATDFTVYAGAGMNESGATYVAYIFAHDPSADGFIQCGSVTGTGAVSVSLGWEPQYVLIKCSTDGSADWEIFDTARGMPVDNTLSGGGSVGAGDRRLCPNSSAAEDGFYAIEPTATGFKYIKFGSPATYVYMAIRRPNKPPTSGMEVYNAIAYTGDGVSGRSITGAGFAPDTCIIKSRSSGSAQWNWLDRLRGAKQRLSSNDTSVESNDGGSPDFLMDGFKVDTTSFGYNTSSLTFINHFFRRAPGFFDVVCYVGDGNNGRAVQHGLTVSPELVIIKKRNTTGNWSVTLSSPKTSFWLNGTNAGGTNINSTTSQYGYTDSVTATDISVGGYLGQADVNEPGSSYVALLFASKPGISKIGIYTGNGTSQTIDCGFSTGARFVLIKRMNAVGDWYVWDTTRGIIAANDPHLSLNSTATEVTTNDSVDPDSTGFIVNQVAATNVNVSGATYLFLAIA